jgi:hypothetical protein
VGSTLLPPQQCITLPVSSPKAYTEIHLGNCDEQADQNLTGGGNRLAEHKEFKKVE